MKKILLIFFLLLLTFLGYFIYKFLASKQIFLQSEHPLYTLSKTNNFSDFQNYLNGVGFWRKGAQYNPVTKFPETAKNLYIVLTDTPQSGSNWVDGPVGEEKLLASFEYKIEGNDVSIYLHVDPTVAQETGLNLDNVFNTYLMRASYMLVENRGLLTEQNDKVADELIDAKYKEPYMVLKEKNKTGLNIFKLLVPTVYAYHSGDCQSWQCGIATSSKRCVGGPNNGQPCVTSFPKCWPGGVCTTFTQCSAAYWEGHSGSSCISPACPGSQCVVSGSNHCSCGAPTPPPCSCGSWTNQACGGNGCAATQRHQTRDCNPNGCSSESRCVSDASCGGPPPTPPPGSSPPPTPTPPPGGGGGCGSACTVNADCQAGFTCIGTNVCWNNAQCDTATPPPPPPEAPACDPNQLNMSISPNPGTVDSSMTFSLSGSQGSTWIDDSWTGGVNCSGAFWDPPKTCGATTAGSYSWTHYWKNCAPNDCSITSAQCSKTADYTVVAPTCTVNLTPDTASVQTGSSTTLTAGVTVGSGTVTQVNFASANTGIATVNPASDSTVVYSTQATGVSVGSTTVRADVIMSGASRCNDTSTVNVTPPGPWWQVKDADVTTNGNLISPIPGSCSLPACNPVFGLKGTGGFPGVPAYGGATADFLSGAGTGSAAESPYNWLVASRYLGRVYDYAYFERQIPDDIVINELTPPVTGGTFNSGGAPSRGYVWYHWNGPTLGDLTITGNLNLVGSRKVVLMVEGANLTINGRIQLQNPGQGFFMAVVGKTAGGLKGDILVAPSVDTIEGIFLAESEFKTGVSSNQLQVRGSVVAYDGVSLQRDLGAGNANTPAEVFEYAPDIIATFPSVFTQRRMRWKEVAP